jgi:class 3 adenylate cyclase/tetratricopeptide (TPR) repeat protein
VGPWEDLVKCARCSRDNPADARFCNGCGQPLPLEPAAVREPAPRAYTPAYLAERILTSRSALEGERKQVTVLFADLRGSMEMLMDRDPEEARALLDSVVELMMDAVHRYEGTVNQVMGDGIMALFGAPLAHEDHAVRACFAALAIQSAIRRRNTQARAADGIEVQVRIGLNSGDVVVRTIGNDLRMDYSAVGQSTFLAARMEQLAAPGTILLSADTHRLAEGFVRVRPLGALPVKGAEPVVAFELLDASPPRTRWHTRIARGLGRFVGRDDELEALLAALRQADEGRGQIVALVGEPGVGKSRLVWELNHRPGGPERLVLECGAVPYERTTPYGPVVDLLRDYFHVDAHDDTRAIRDRVVARCEAQGEAFRPLTSALLELLDVPVEDPAWRTLDPPQRRQRTHEALQRLVLAESRRQPVVVVVEDLQWIDTETRAFLDSLVEGVRDAPILLVVTCRPEYRPGWAGAHYTERPVPPLAALGVEALLDALLGGDASLAPLKRLLIDRTEGNPFFLEESVQTLAETGVLAGAPGDYRLARPLTTIQMPPTVHAVLASRIDRLTPTQKRLLQTAAVVGRDVELPVLRAITEAPDDVLQRDLAHLQLAGLLYETHPFPDPAYTFKHALTHEVAYQSLLQDRRRVLHARIVEALEALYPDRVGEQVERLARHAFLGESWARALVYLRQGGTKAAARSAHTEAVALFEQALQALAHVPPGRSRDEQAVDLRLLLANSLVPIAEVRPIIDHLREAERLAAGLGDQRRAGRVSSFLSAYFWLTGEQKLAVEHAQRVLEIAGATGDVGARVRAHLDLGQAYHVVGDYRLAVDVLGRNVDALQGELLGRRFGLVGLASVLSRAWLVWCLAELGEFERAVPLGEEAIRIAEAVDHPYSILTARFGVGGLHLRRGDLTRAIAVLEHALELCRTWDSQLRLWFLGVAPSLAHAYALTGQTSQAIALLERATAQAAASKMMFAQPLRLGWLAHAYFRAGRAPEAHRLAREALALARHQSERGHEVWIHGIVGEMAAHEADVATAEAAYGAAIELGDALGMRPRVAVTQLGLGRLCRQTGRPAEARRHLEAASAFLGAAQMPLWLEQVQAELSALG